MNYCYKSDSLELLQTPLIVCTCGCACMPVFVCMNTRTHTSYKAVQYRNSNYKLFEMIKNGSRHYYLLRLLMISF